MEKKFPDAETWTLSPTGIKSVKGINSYRIESLRVYLEKQIGANQFYNAYKFLQDPPNEGEHNSELVKILGKQNIKYVSLIYQMIVCEDAYYGSN
jgi:hypothetical protein